MALPRYVALKSNYNGKYLRYIDQNEQVHGFLQFSGDEASSPYAKLEVVPAGSTGEGLVHLKCCYNGKYLTRWSESHWWIVAGADEREEDRYKWSCTLFRPDFTGDPQSLRFLHVQLGHYACLWRFEQPYTDCLFGGSPSYDQDQCDVCTFVDCDSGNTALPRYVSLKSKYNDKYLRYIDENSQVCGFLKFSGDEAKSPYAKLEVVAAAGSEGLVHLKCCYNGKYLRRWSESHWWIVAGGEQPEEDRCKWSCTLFRPVSAGDCGSVRFLHVQLGHYACLWRCEQPFTDCLFGGSPSYDQDQCDVCTLVDWESI